MPHMQAARYWVALRKESVDRNSYSQHVIRPSRVALRKESVDRNFIELLPRGGWGVALRKESVDRNKLDLPLQVRRPESLSARRAWIEIEMRHNVCRGFGSLSARRAWIEISRAPPTVDPLASLSARRAWIEIRAYGVYSSASYLSRSPQGERG